jgi:hypothetical protein
MSTKLRCTCGFDRDTVQFDGGPVFDGGMVLHFITDDGFGGTFRTVHQCAFCTELILQQLPWLKEDWEPPEQPQPPTRRKK